MKQIKKMVTIVLLNFILLAITVFIVGNTTNLTTIFASILGVEQPTVATTIQKPAITTTTISSNKNKTAIKVSLPKNACIITIDNLKYNITPFRKKHSGGDIFICNSDMTKTFYQNHKKIYLNQMKPYLI